MQDMEYLMSMYPSGVKKLQRYVSEACDRMEYKNSPMYDEFPDHIVVNQMCDSICDTVISEEGLTQVQELWSITERDRSSVESQELKKEMNRLGAVSTLPEHNTDEAENSQARNTDANYIGESGENGREKMDTQEETIQTQEMRWNQPMFGAPEQGQGPQNQACFGPANSRNENFSRTAQYTGSGSAGFSMGVGQPGGMSQPQHMSMSYGAGAGNGQNVGMQPPQPLTDGRGVGIAQPQTATDGTGAKPRRNSDMGMPQSQPVNSIDSNRVWDSGKSQQMPEQFQAGPNNRWNPGAGQPLPLREENQTGSGWNLGPMPQSQGSLFNTVNSAWPFQGPIGVNGPVRQGGTAMGPEITDQRSNMLFEGTVNQWNSGMFPQDMMRAGNGQNPGPMFSNPFAQENDANQGFSQPFGRIPNTAYMGEAPLNSNVGLGRELLSQATVSREIEENTEETLADSGSHSEGDRPSGEESDKNNVPDIVNIERNSGDERIQQAQEETSEQGDENLRDSSTVSGLEINGGRRMPMNAAQNNGRPRPQQPLGPGPVRPESPRPSRPPQPPLGPGPVRPQPPRPPQPPLGPGPVRPPQPPRPPRPPRPPQPPRPQPDRPSWLRDMIKVLLLNEFFHRRCNTGTCII